MIMPQQVFNISTYQKMSNRGGDHYQNQKEGLENKQEESYTNMYKESTEYYQTGQNEESQTVNIRLSDQENADEDYVEGARKSQENEQKNKEQEYKQAMLKKDEKIKQLEETIEGLQENKCEQVGKMSKEMEKIKQEIGAHKQNAENLSKQLKRAEQKNKNKECELRMQMLTLNYQLSQSEIYLKQLHQIQKYRSQSLKLMEENIKLENQKTRLNKQLLQQKRVLNQAEANLKVALHKKKIYEKSSEQLSQKHQSMKITNSRKIEQLEKAIKECEQKNQRQLKEQQEKLNEENQKRYSLEKKFKGLREDYQKLKQQKIANEQFLNIKMNQLSQKTQYISQIQDFIRETASRIAKVEVSKKIGIKKVVQILEKQVNKLRVDASNNDRYVREVYGKNGGNKNESVSIQDMMSYIGQKNIEKLEKFQRDCNQFECFLNKILKMGKQYENEEYSVGQMLMHKVQLKTEKLLSGYVQTKQKDLEPRQNSQSMIVGNSDSEEEDRKLKKTFRGKQQSQIQ